MAKKKKKKSGNGVDRTKNGPTKKRRTQKKPQYANPNLLNGKENIMSNMINMNWEKVEIIEVYRNDSEMYNATHKDSMGLYSFCIERLDDKKVKVRVEGTHHNPSIMSKDQVFWEWDMIWNTSGKPEVLKEEVDGLVKVGKEGQSHSGHRGQDLVKRKDYQKRHEGEIVYYESNRAYYQKIEGKLKYLGTKLKTA